MERNEQCDIFWKQYHGLVRALDLPQEYKIHDKRINCINGECNIKERCLFHKRFKAEQWWITKNTEGWFKRHLIKEQNGQEKRPVWDKYYPAPYYGSASFHFYVEQHGTECPFFEDSENN